MVFAVVLGDPGLADIDHRFPGSLAAGLVYGATLAVVGMGLVMPMWLRAIGPGTGPELPFVSLSLFAWHLVFGLVLGALFPALDGP